MRGKKTCKILKEIRQRIAEDNDIELITSECTYQGDCLGTCPKCEAEVRYLERELAKHQALGKAAIISGMAVTTLFGMSSCDGNTPQPTEGLIQAPDTIEMLEGDVPYENTLPDSTSDGTGNNEYKLEGDVCAPVRTEEEDGLLPKSDKDNTTTTHND